MVIYNSISFNRDNYKDEESFKKDVMNFMMTLVKNNYECRFYYEDCGIYILEYNYSTFCEDLGNDRLMWVSYDEQEHLIAERTYLADEKNND